MFFFTDFIYLFLERGEGREKEKIDVISGQDGGVGKYAFLNNYSKNYN